MGKRDKEVHFVMSEEEISRMRMKMEELAFVARVPISVKWRWTVIV